MASREEEAEFLETLKARARAVELATLRIHEDTPTFKATVPKDQYSRSVKALSVHAAPFSSTIEKYSKARGVDPDIVRAIIAVEQRGNDTPGTYKVSPAGARGIAQLMPDTAARFKVNTKSQKDSIRGAVEVVAELQERLHTKDPRFLAASYNTGDKIVRELGTNLPSMLAPETRNYVGMFDETYNHLKSKPKVKP